MLDLARFGRIQVDLVKFGRLRMDLGVDLGGGVDLAQGQIGAISVDGSWSG